MAHLGPNPSVLRLRIGKRDLASIRKLARSAEVSVSEMIRTLIRRARVADRQVAP